MGSGIYVALSGAKAETNHIDVIANNLANISTIGFRSDDLLFSSLLSKDAAKMGVKGSLPAEAEILPGLDHSSLSKMNNFVQIVGGKTDFSQGRLLKTDDPLNVAIQGEGFFVVQDKEGEKYYTRDGSFHLNEEMELTHSSGDRVMDENDAPIRIDLSKEFEIKSDGRIVQDGKEMAKIALVKFTEPSQLQKKGHSQFINTKPETPPEPDTKSIVMDGMLERSNVNPIAEMTKLIAVSRRFEIIQQLIKQHYKLDEQSIQRAR